MISKCLKDMFDVFCEHTVSEGGETQYCKGLPYCLHAVYLNADIFMTCDMHMVFAPGGHPFCGIEKKKMSEKKIKILTTD